MDQDGPPERASDPPVQGSVRRDKDGAPTRRTRTRLDPEVRRGLILDAATRVLSIGDPTVVTFEQIAEEAGVSRALIYNYFGDKSGVIAAVYLRSIEELDLRLDATFRDHRHDSTAPERLRSVVRTYLEFAEEHREVWRLMGMAEAAMHPTVVANRRSRYGLIATSWGGNSEARMLARGVVGLLEASALDWLDAPDVGIDRAVAVIQAMVWSGLSGLGPFGIVVPEAEAEAEADAVSPQDA